MPLPAQGLFKTISVAKQAGLGTPMTAAGSGTYLRRKSAVFSLTRDTTKVDEIVSHRQDTGIVYGQKKTQGKVDGVLSSGTWAKFFAAALMKDMTVTTPCVVGTATMSVGTNSSVGTAVTPTSPLAGGIKQGDVGQFTGFTTTGTPNNSKNLVVIGVTASNMTVQSLDDSAMIAGAAAGACTFAPSGKKSIVPLTGHTNDYFTVEEWYPSPTTRSEVWPDMKPNKIDVSIPAAGACTISLDLMGVGTRTPATAQQMASVVSETTFGALQAVTGLLVINGSEYVNVTSVSFTIDRGLSPIGASIGNAAAPDFNIGKIQVSGTFTAMFNDSVLQTLYEAGTALNLIVVAAADTSPTSDFMAFTFGRIKLTGDAPDDGEKVISRTYPFSAEINGAGGTALAWDKTIMTVQDSQG